MDSKLTFGAMTGAIFGLVLCCSQPAYAGGTGTDPCSLLTQAQVSAALGMNADPAKRLTPTMCGWSAPNQPNMWYQLPGHTFFRALHSKFGEVFGRTPGVNCGAGGVKQVSPAKRVRLHIQRLSAF